MYSVFPGFPDGCDVIPAMCAAVPPHLVSPPVCVLLQRSPSLPPPPSAHLRASPSHGPALFAGKNAKMAEKTW